MDLGTLGFAMGSAWLSGINLYVTVLTLGLLQRFGLAHLPGDLGYLSHTWVLVTAGALYLVQFVADKIPAVDSVWDVVHTFIRVPAGAVLAATAFAHLDPAVRVIAFLVGGGIALSSHSTKTATRLAANTSPEPFSNIALSLAGDALTVGGSLLMAMHPAVLIAIVIVAVVASILLLHWIVRSMRKLFRRAPVVRAGARA
ncbi:MAG TPA: DUF4126 domain-containing protein [Bryobacteraceae bacterium]|jgi:hypothetical protein|nr:DUF4126 domain-containing protein [Bryobacteraceae bacterium]